MYRPFAALAVLLTLGFATPTAVRADTQVYIENADETNPVTYDIKCGPNGAWRTIDVNPHRRQGYSDCATSFYVRFQAADNRAESTLRLRDGTVNTFRWNDDGQEWRLTARDMRDDE
jgi:hypothetical protein